MVKAPKRQRHATKDPFNVLKGFINDIPNIPVNYEEAAKIGTKPKFEESDIIYGVSGLASNNPNIGSTSQTMLTVPAGFVYRIVGFTHYMQGDVSGSFVSTTTLVAGGTTVDTITVPTQNPAAVTERDLFFPKDTEISVYPGGTFVINVTAGTSQTTVYYQIFSINTK
jgi:hypothetical protein